MQGTPTKKKRDMKLGQGKFPCGERPKGMKKTVPKKSKANKAEKPKTKLKKGKEEQVSFPISLSPTLACVSWVQPPL